MASPTEQTHPRILKKKKKKTNIESEIKLTHGHVAAENTEKTNPQYTEIVYTDYNLQSKSKTNQKQYCVYQKKKNPIQSLCTKTAKPNQKNPNTRSFVTVTRSSSSSPQLAYRRRCRNSPFIADRRSQTVDRNRRSLCSTPMLDARC